MIIFAYLVEFFVESIARSQWLCFKDPQPPTHFVTLQIKTPRAQDACAVGWFNIEGCTAGPARKKDPATGVCRRSAFFQVSSVLCLGKVGRGCSGHSSSQECPEFLPGKNTFDSKARASVTCRLPATQHNSRYPGRKELFTINHSANCLGSWYTRASAPGRQNSLINIGNLQGLPDCPVIKTPSFQEQGAWV